MATEPEVDCGDPFYYELTCRCGRRYGFILEQIGNPIPPGFVVLAPEHTVGWVVVTCPECEMKVEETEHVVAVDYTEAV